MGVVLSHFGKYLNSSENTVKTRKDTVIKESMSSHDDNTARISGSAKSELAERCVSERKRSRSDNFESDSQGHAGVSVNARKDDLSEQNEITDEYCAPGIKCSKAENHSASVLPMDADPVDDASRSGDGDVEPKSYADFMLSSLLSRSDNFESDSQGHPGVSVNARKDDLSEQNEITDDYCAPGIECSKAENHSASVLPMDADPVDDASGSVDGDVEHEFDADFMLSSLPAHMMLRVFSYLPLTDLLLRTSLVCKDWHDLARDSSLWRDVDLSGHMKVDDAVVARSISYSDNVTKLNLTDARLITGQGVLHALTRCPNLTLLKLTRCHQLEGFCFPPIGGYCPLLVSLRLHCCFKLSDRALAEIGSGCPRLKDVFLSQCSDITSVGVTSLAQGCPKLRTLSLDQCAKINDDCLADLAEYCKELDCLCAMSCLFTDAGILKLAKLTKLSCLEIPNIPALTPTGVSRLVQHRPSLTHLNLSLLRSINDECIQVIAEKLHALQGLTLVSCNISDNALAALGKHCKRLKHLDVGWCKKITNDGVTAITEANTALTYLGLMRCDQVTEKFSEEMVAKYPQISFSTMYLDFRELLQRANVLKDKHQEKT